MNLGNGQEDLVKWSRLIFGIIKTKFMTNFYRNINITFLIVGGLKNSF